MSENVRMEINVKLHELQEFLTCISGKHTIMKTIKIWEGGKALQNRTQEQSP